jgi:methionyl-tRNA synthetase
MNNEKMSKSLGNVVDPIDLISKYGRDVLRYFLLKEMSLDNDVNFSEKLLTETFNTDLANIYGNLVSRFIGMVNKYSNGVIQKTKIKGDGLANEIIEELKKLIQNASQNINAYKIKELIYEVLDFAKKLNRYVEQTKP